MEVDLEIVNYGNGPYLRVHVESQYEEGSAVLSLKELKQALEDA